MLEEWRSNLPDFNSNEGTDQPVSIYPQGDEYVAVIQWDGTGEFQHWVLIRRDEIDAVIKRLEELK